MRTKQFDISITSNALPLHTMMSDKPVAYIESTYTVRIEANLEVPHSELRRFLPSISEEQFAAWLAEQLEGVE